MSGYWQWLMKMSKNYKLHKNSFYAPSVNLAADTSLKGEMSV